MASALGSLVVSLGLDAAEFVSGMTKSEYEAKKFAGTIDRAVAVGVVKAELAIRALGAAARVAGDAFQSLTEGAAKFQDLAEITGASAEGIASLSTAAAVGGVSIESVADAVNKLNKNLLGVDDESKAAGAALKALNIPIEEFKRLDPVAQYERIGKELSTFTDHNKKAQVAVALLGKAGAEQLKVFKALEEQGGRQTILTQQQIEAADAFADAQARASAELRQYAQAAAAEALPALRDLTLVAVELAKQFLGIDAATGKLAANNGAKQFAESAADSLASLIDIGDGVARTFQVIGKAYGGGFAAFKATMEGDYALARRISAEARADIDSVLQRATASALLARQRADSAKTEAARRVEDRGFDARGALNFDGASGLDAAAKAAAKFAKEQRDLSVIVSDFGSTQSGAETARLLRYEEVLAALPEVIRPVQTAQEEMVQAFLRSEKEAYAVVDDLMKAAAESDKARLDALTADTFGRSMKEALKDIELLNDAYARGAIDVQTWAEAVKNATKKIKTPAEEAKEAAKELGFAFQSSFEDAIVEGKKFSEVLRGLAKDVLRIALRRGITDRLGTSLGDKLGDIFKDIKIPGFAVGTDYVPRDMLAMVHKGERIVPAAENKQLTTRSALGSVGMGGGVQNNITIQTPPGTRAETQESRNDAGGIDTLIRIIDERQAAGVVRGGSKLAKAIEGTYQARRVSSAPRRG